MAFIAVITTSMIIIATKGFRLSNKGVDMASAYQVCEAVMEDYTSTSQKSETIWSGIASITTPTFASRKDEQENIVEDKRFCYTVDVTNVGTELKRVQVRVFHAQENSTAAAIDTAQPRQGELFRLTNFLPKPANASETGGGGGMSIP